VPPSSTLFAYTTLFRSERSLPLLSANRYEIVRLRSPVQLLAFAAVVAFAAGCSATRVHHTAKKEKTRTCVPGYRSLGNDQVAYRSEEHTSELQSPYDLV